MNKVIYKYEFVPVDEFSILMSPVVKFLHVEQQKSDAARPNLAIWAMVDKDGPIEPRYFKIRGTGHACNELDGFEFIGTALERNGLVWHIFVQSVDGEKNEESG